MDLTDVDDSDLRASIGAFEAALTARLPRILEPDLKCILLAVDGSNQDDTARELAGAIASRFGAAIDVLCAKRVAGDGSPAEVRDRHVELLKASGLTVRVVDDAGEKPPFERILAAAKACDLIVLCAPFQEDYEELGSASVGTNLDMLMARTTVPLLVVRQPLDNAARCLDHVVVALRPFVDVVIDAAGWAMRLVSEDGLVRLLSLIDQATLGQEGRPEPDQQASSAQQASQLERREFDVDAEDEKELAGLHQPRIAGLIAAAQKQAASRGVNCRVSVRSGDAVARTIEVAHESQSLLVVGIASDTASGNAGDQANDQAMSPSALRAQALVRASRHPILVVSDRAERSQAESP